MSAICQKATQNFNLFKFSALRIIRLVYLFDCEHQKVRDGQLFVKEGVTDLSGFW
jgi:hypothetical protein